MFTFVVMPTLIDKEVQLLTQIRNGDERAIDEIYVTSKAQFLTFARKLLNDENILEDIYQDTVIAFYENVRTGKITSLKSSITTYIIGLLVLAGIAGILYLLGIHETFGFAGMCITALVLTFVIVFFVSR